MNIFPGMASIVDLKVGQKKKTREPYCVYQNVLTHLRTAIPSLITGESFISSLFGVQRMAQW